MIKWWHAWRIPILSTLGFVVVLAVAYVTGSISWRHIVHVGHMVEEPSAALLPVSVDGMMLVGAIMAWIDNMRGYKARVWSIVALWLGSWLTLAFNAMSAYERGWSAVGLAMVPAVAFLVTVESVFHPSQRFMTMAKKVIVHAGATAVVDPVTVPAPVAETVGVPAPEVTIPPVAPVVKPRRRKPRQTTEHPAPRKPRQGASPNGHGPTVEATTPDEHRADVAAEPLAIEAMPTTNALELFHAPSLVE